MTNDPELKAMSEVFDALQSLDASTQKRVVDWVLAKFSSSPATNNSTDGKRGAKPRSRRVGKKHGRKPSTESTVSTTTSTGAKRGPKPGSKQTGKKGTPKKGKVGRPKGSRSVSNTNLRQPKKRPGRPRNVDKPTSA